MPFGLPGIPQLITCCIQVVDDDNSIIRDDSRHSRAALLCDLPAFQTMPVNPGRTRDAKDQKRYA